MTDSCTYLVNNRYSIDMPTIQMLCLVLDKLSLEKAQAIKVDKCAILVEINNENYWVFKHITGKPHNTIVIEGKMKQFNHLRPQDEFIPKELPTCFCKYLGNLSNHNNINQISMYLIERILEDDQLKERDCNGPYESISNIHKLVYKRWVTGTIFGLASTVLQIESANSSVNETVSNHRSANSWCNIS